MADVLRLPEETLAMSFVYLNRYKRYCSVANSHELLDSHTLSLACLSLASKSTEAPRRLREFLLPAYRILHFRNAAAESLTFPSNKYDSLRATVVQAELILLRVLKFELRIILPFEFLPRYLDRTIGGINTGGAGWGGTEDYDGFGKEHRDEYKIVDLMETGTGRACRARAVEACENYQLANFFPARAVAAACLHMTLKERGMKFGSNPQVWLEDVTSGRVELADFEEILGELKQNENQNQIVG
ncbi:MAG: hypothetical protein M1827_005067 [Pycnora praestabilis]|nr:MAG: hypothetical protein M1827_005067 [Pycnora praestabilis]